MGIKKPPYEGYTYCGNKATGQETLLALTADSVLSKLIDN